MSSKDNEDYVEDLSEVSSIDERLDDKQVAVDPDLGDHPSGGQIYTMGRLPKSQGHRGLIFMEKLAGVRRPALFARQQGFHASKSNQEVVFERGGPGGAPAGHINFHHWLMDQSRSLIVGNASGQETDLRRKGLSSAHTFDLNGEKLTWHRTGPREGQGVMFKMRRNHLECVDVNGEVYAVFEIQKIMCTGNSGPTEKPLGQLEIKKDGLNTEEIEFLIMTMTAVYIKLQKRMIQGSQAGIAGGLATAVGYIVAG